MRREDRLVSRLEHIRRYGERAKNAVRGRRLEEMEQIEVDGLCYLVLVLTEAAIQSLALDESLDGRYPSIPWRDIRDMGNRLRHGYASVDLQVVHEVVESGHIDELLDFARRELALRGVISVEETRTDC